MKILLVEPNSLLASQYKEVLISSGHEVVWCSDGQVAILSLDKSSADLILMELILPSHSGVEFLYELRSYPEWKIIPVVILSRVSVEQSSLDDRTMKTLGVLKYLYKPKTKLSDLSDIAKTIASSIK